MTRRTSDTPTWRPRGASCDEHGEACQTCHVTGQSGMIATQQSTAMFGVNLANKYYCSNSSPST